MDFPTSATRLRAKLHGRNKALRLRNATRNIRDAGLKGLGIRIYPTGHESFFAHTQHQRQRIWKIVGGASEVNLVKARKRAQALLAATRISTPASTDATLFETADDRSASVLSIIMTRAEDNGYRPQANNPCTGIRRTAGKDRGRFCSVEEVRRLGLVLKQQEQRFPTQAAIIRLLLLTGCRGQEVVSLRWTESCEGHLHLSDRKTGPRMV